MVGPRIDATQLGALVVETLLNGMTPVIECPSSDVLTLLRRGISCLMGPMYGLVGKTFTTTKRTFLQATIVHRDFASSHNHWPLGVRLCTGISSFRVCSGFSGSF
jgi:hypothetical protein